MKPENPPPPGLVCRTVYDARPGAPALRHLCLAVMNAATWAVYVKPSGIPLELKIVGKPSEGLVEHLQALGVSIASEQAPHELYKASPTYNKLLSLPDTEPESRILIVDNDTALLGDLGALADYSADTAYLSVADKVRISKELWQELVSQLNIPVIQEDWIAWFDRFESTKNGKQPRVNRNLYFNSGVLLLPRGSGAVRVGRLWNEYSRKLSEYCNQRDYAQRQTLGSDQASLSMAIADYRQVGHLPLAYHYRPPHFWYGDLEGDHISVFHAFGNRPVFDPLPRKDKWVLNKIVDAYFDNFVNQHCPEGDSRRIASDIVRDKINSAISDCACNDIARWWRAAVNDDS